MFCVLATGKLDLLVLHAAVPGGDVGAGPGVVTHDLQPGIAPADRQHPLVAHPLHAAVGGRGVSGVELSRIPNKFIFRQNQWVQVLLVFIS